MFDARLRPLIDPPLNAVGTRFAGMGVSANSVTLAGMLVGIGAALAIALGAYWAGLALIIANRIADGVDGAIARASGKTGFGGYLDILCDFAFYVAVPLGFAAAAPTNMLPALLLVASFTLTGISFLAFAAIAAQRGEETSAHGQKSFFYSTGIAEGSETIAVFIAMCLFPSFFPVIAMAYAVLCVITVGQRTWLAWVQFRE
jgi:phosphatidylglycerophosphate synthase